MDREEENFQANLPVSFPGMEYSLDQLQLLRSRADESSDFMLNPPPSGFCHSNSLDKLSFSEVMQFADYGPKLGSNQTKISNEENVLDPVYMLKFPVLSDKLEGQEEEGEEGEGLVCENTSGQFQFVGSSDFLKDSNTGGIEPTKNRRKRPRSMKTTEEVESQRMTHIAVERNRRKQMNEHLRVLRSLMPGSYVQRGDQASIIGGAIEFVRELEQLLQCLESQKRRRIFGDAPRCLESPPLSIQQQQQQQPAPFFLHQNDLKLLDFDTPLREETAENKSCLADVEVKLLGFDAIIKILSQRRPGQLVKTIAALEDLQLNILHTNITTIEQTVLYSFNVKIMGDSRFTAENIANSVQQIFNFIHASTM